MPTVRLSRSAERWFLAKIAELAQLDPQAARRLIKRLERQKALLASFPSMTEQGLIAGTRKVSMPPLVLTIRQKDGVIEIAAIRDGRQKDALAPTELQFSQTTDDDEPADDR
ncbi:type II toxin-antitoxin system RelE/ParE family toxin [Rhizobium sp. FY34]|uniref:type II toxin-antitoxin system RelE/ParE family toxin n=1 Tax=Rhizobium sp. FY34 TaxID=2562309 RepID=UPI0010C05B72|nr:type II toxin-antitoxin system RelE/ParE family toxin [Rhizobium sp. FY34]